MHLHEYQAKNLLKKWGVPVTPGFVISSLQELEEVVNREHLTQAVLKVQIHAGGRGKAGGVKIAKSREEILAFGKELLFKKIVNHQTGPLGMEAHQLLICPLTEFVKEYYVAIAIDRKMGCAVLLASPEGGMEIEEISRTCPEKLMKVTLTLQGKIANPQAIVDFMGWHERDKPFLGAMAEAFVKSDAVLMEINPLVRTRAGELVALDAKVTLDEDAFFRHPEWVGQEDLTQLPPNESKAKEVGLAYITLQGNIGCMVNGAGLAMATMDIIKHFGGQPANFLDVGGGATFEKIKEGFKLLLQDTQVKAILVNIFGGIMNCETLADGILSAVEEVHLTVPLVVRMEGTAVEKGKAKLAHSGVKMELADNLEEAAKKVVAVCRY